MEPEDLVVIEGGIGLEDMVERGTVLQMKEIINLVRKMLIIGP